MENCLVTKLKGVVDNPNLPFLNGIMFKVNVKSGESYKFYAQTSSSSLVSKAYIYGDALWNDTNTKEHNIYYYETAYGPSHQFTAQSDGEVIIKIKDRQNIDGFSFDNIREYISEVNVGDFNYVELTNLAIAGLLVDKQSIDDLKDCTSLLTLRTSYGYMKGNIESLVKCINLTELDVSNYTYITGEINALAAGMVTNGRTSGTLDISCNKHVTFGGVVVGNEVHKIITFDSSYTNGYSVS